MERQEALEKLADAFPGCAVDISLNHGKIQATVSNDARQAGILLSDYTQIENAIAPLRDWITP